MSGRNASMRARIRWAADGPLVLLVALAVVLVGSLLLFVAGRTLPFDPLVACSTTAATIAARAMSLGVMLPLGVVAVVMLTALLALGHQLWATRRVLRAVLATRRPHTARLASAVRRAGLDGRVDLIEDAAVYTFCFGLVRPRVCLSTGLTALLSDDELDAVLLHEAHHMRHRDPVKILASRTLASGLMFLPLAGALHDSFLAGKEMCADEDAAVGGRDLALASALVKLIAAERPSWPAGVLAVGAFSPTEARLRRLVDEDASLFVMPSAVDWIASAALVAGIFGFSYGSAAAGQVLPASVACDAEVVHVEAIDAAAHAPVGDASATEAGDAVARPVTVRELGQPLLLRLDPLDRRTSSFESSADRPAH